MLKKCLKYDLKAILRLWWIIAASMLGAALIASIGIRFFIEVTRMESPNSALSLLSFAGLFSAIPCCIILFAGLTLSFILVYWRFYSHFYTDEGYLTFTLPIKRSTLYLSKVISGSIIELSTIAVFFLSIGLIVLIVPPTGFDGLLNFVAYKAIGQAIQLLWAGVGPWLLLWIPLILALLVLFQLCGSGLTYLCVTIGAVVAKKHKLLAGIGIYYLVNTLLSLVSQFVSMFLSAGIFYTIGIIIQSGGAATGLGVAAILLITCAIAATIAICFHFISLDKVERKLNLA